MKYTVIQAAKIIGKSRQTLYRHIDSKPISVTLDDDGTQYIEASELMRIYGNNINFDAIHETPPLKEAVTPTQNVTETQQNVTPSIDEKLRIVELEAQLQGLKAQLLSKENEAGFIKELLEEEKTERKAANNLLEDHRGKARQWDQQFSALEQRLEKQEKEAQERAETETKLLEQNKRVKQAYLKKKRDLEKEQEKGFFAKLFG